MSGTPIVCSYIFCLPVRPWLPTRQPVVRREDDERVAMQIATLQFRDDPADWCIEMRNEGVVDREFVCAPSPLAAVAAVAIRRGRRDCRDRTDARWRSLAAAAAARRASFRDPRRREPRVVRGREVHVQEERPRVALAEQLDRRFGECLADVRRQAHASFGMRSPIVVAKHPADVAGDRLLETIERVRERSLTAARREQAARCIVAASHGRAGRVPFADVPSAIAGRGEYPAVAAAGRSACRSGREPGQTPCTR